MQKTFLGFPKANLYLMALLIFVTFGILAFSVIKSPSMKSFAASRMAVPLKMENNSAPVNVAELRNGFASVIDPALPAVVNISSTKIVKQENNLPNMFSTDPLFQRFFGGQFGDQSHTPRTEREHSLGSGVIVNPDGYILTNNHVVASASDVEVFTQNNKKFKAKVVGTDPRTDIAVLKIDANHLPALTIGDSSKLKVGDLVFAIGDPFGVGETATMGIVSATGRGLGGALEHYEDFIQTDAAINPGNSGGALLDVHGNLVGINTAIITGGGGGNQGVGFAIPVNMARNVMQQIVEHGKVIRGQLGVAIQGVDADMGKAFGLNQGGGALIAEVTPGSAAAKAGIERGDIITELNGQPVQGPDDLSVHISELAPGTTVQLKVVRNGQTRDISATLGELSTKEEQAATSTSKSSALQGVQVESLTPAIARQLGVAASMSGVVITSVDPSSAAAAADLESGDVVQEVNRKPVHNIAEYERALAGVDNQSVLLLVNRGGSSRFIVIEPQASE